MICNSDIDRHNLRINVNLHCGHTRIPLFVVSCIDYTNTSNLTWLIFSHTAKGFMVHFKLIFLTIPQKGAFILILGFFNHRSWHCAKILTNNLIKNFVQSRHKSDVSLNHLFQVWVIHPHSLKGYHKVNFKE